jgi:hypothetical protein
LPCWSVACFAFALWIRLRARVLPVVAIVASEIARTLPTCNVSSDGPGVGCDGKLPLSLSQTASCLLRTDPDRWRYILIAAS